MSAVYPSNGGFGPAAGLGLSLPLPSASGAARTGSVPWNAGFAPSGAKAPLPSDLRAGRKAGLAWVVGLHVLVGWALTSGLARDVVESVKPPIEMIIVPEIIPEPPPPPPKIEQIKEARRPPQAPAYVPPPDITPVVPSVPVIADVQSTPPPAPVAIEPPPPEPLPVARIEPAKQEIGVACPGYQAVIAEAMESAFERVGIPGTVRTLLKVRGTQVTEVLPQSGPKQYYKYLQAAIKRMQCSALGNSEVLVTLDVVFQP